MCPRGGDFQRKSQKLRYLTDRYMCTSSAHVLHGSQAHHPWCQSVIICPLDQVSDSLVRWKMWKFPTEKSGNYAIQRTDTSVQATRMHCMDHKRAIHNVKVCWSFRWIKQYTHLSVAKLLINRIEFFQRVIPSPSDTCVECVHLDVLVHLDVDTRYLANQPV